MITLNQVGMAYGQRVLFYDVNLKLNSGKRYALVGANGAGKSTLFNLITGEEETTSGEVSIPKAASVGWLRQDQFRYEETPIADVVMQGRPKLWQALQDKEVILQNTDWDEATCHEFAEIEAVIEHYDGYTADSYAAMILEGLGIASQFQQQPLKSLSGGYKLRVLLAQVLFQNPSILLLDEPTNHLDIVSIRWLESFLKSEFSGLVVFISHDLEFIDNVSDVILDLDYGEIRPYNSKYQKFLIEKTLLAEQKALEIKSVEVRVKELQKFVDKNQARASKAKQAQSRVKMIEKIEIPDGKQSSRIAPKFAFAEKRKSGKNVVKVSNIAKQYPNKKLFSSLSFNIMRGEKLAIMGVNGAGKSTLLKIILDEVAHDSGEITWGHEVKIGYVSQDHHDKFTKSQSVLDWLTEHAVGCTEQQVRKMLGKLLFSQDEVKKNVLKISGGEAARLLLAMEMLSGPNVLILDEPTNHMDIETIEALANALAKYDGTLIFISHNRFFISKIANRFLYFSQDKAIIDFKGKYRDFEQEVLV